MTGATSEHVEILRAARITLVAERRLLARKLTAGGDRSGMDMSAQNRTRFADIQASIEAVDRALGDEMELARLLRQAS